MTLYIDARYVITYTPPRHTKERTWLVLRPYTVKRRDGFNSVITSCKSYGEALAAVQSFTPPF